MRWKSHVRFGRRPAETHPQQREQGAAGRPHWWDGGPTSLNNLVLVCPKCRYRHLAHYADVCVMPMLLVLWLVGCVLGGGGVGIVIVLVGRREVCRRVGRGLSVSVCRLGFAQALGVSA